jgi:hypothetical protein
MTPTSKKPSIQTGLRIPQDLIERLDAIRGGLTRTEVIVAALRRHLNVPSPAETIGEKRS